MQVEKLIEIVPDHLLSTKLDCHESDEFDRLMSNWFDPEYLREFFNVNKDKLILGSFNQFQSIDDAIRFTMEEADRFAYKLLDREANGITNLDDVFKPLHKSSISIVREESKAYGPSKRSWLRLYGIRIEPDFYAISGGSIKLTKTMQEMTDGEEQLYKLKLVSNYLKRHGIECTEDFSELDIE